MSISVFDRKAVQRHRDRAARDFSGYRFLFDDMADRLVERVGDVLRDFPCVADIGGRDGTLAARLREQRGIGAVVTTDLSPHFSRQNPGWAVVADDEALPFAAGSLDLVVSCLSLHWVNDLPGALLQIRQALKPDGLFIACLWGGETLHELRAALSAAEIAEEGGLSPRVSPFLDLRDAGMLLQRAGFALPVVDQDTLTVSYPSPLKLLADLRGMGESNAVAARRKTVTRRATLWRAMQHYLDSHQDAEGRVNATFQAIWLAGWAPSPDQPKAKERGSATHRLADVLALAEDGLAP